MNNSNEIASGIIKALAAISLPLLVASLLLTHPIFSAIMIFLYVACASVIFSYIFLKNRLGRSIDLMLCGAFLCLGILFFINDGERVPNGYNGWFVAIGYVCMFISLIFFNSFKSKKTNR